jgi:two-component system, NarL family, nitrate/nitrite response regulator NarL
LRAAGEALILGPWSCGLRVLPDPNLGRTPGSAPWPSAPEHVTIGGMHRTVVIVDDHARFRRSARRLLELEGFVVIGEAADGKSAVTEVGRLRPDVALVDVGLPDMTGYEVSERVAGATRVVLVSSRHPVDIGRRVRSCGATGFVAKDELAGARLSALLDGRT